MTDEEFLKQLDRAIQHNLNAGETLSWLRERLLSKTPELKVHEGGEVVLGAGFTINGSEVIDGVTHIKDMTLNEVSIINKQNDGKTFDSWVSGLRVEISPTVVTMVRIWCPVCEKNFKDYDYQYLGGHLLCDCPECDRGWYSKKEGDKYLYKMEFTEDGNDSTNNVK